MSSFGKNIIPRRAHKERAQPSSRISKHGLLEKKKDYKQRARDRNLKQRRLKILKEKAAFRNPDEFYYGMIRSGTDAGRVRKGVNDKEKEAVPIEHREAGMRLLAERRDSGYVGMKCAMEGRRVDRLKKSLHGVAAASGVPRTHVMFVDDEEEMAGLEKELSERKGTGSLHSGGGHRATLRSTKKAYKELQQRQERHGKLRTVLKDMASEKALLSKGRRVLERRANSTTGAPAVYRWQQERKR
ncbi:unnamed protein product [Chondrus crispus]|uniref:U3 small nucleolar RNA-associated protein 11 n=1 Tax=Chondrus crispus TaxID=2769 RepID=R7QSI4_CHOCR|nr:unnamed protein product [Chondrus crispus]CDF41432.1 unnamed protein product [Chondrus crispus]|eukprot:XP_005711726.1 unnamed protein product [Chondrus crispus]